MSSRPILYFALRGLSEREATLFQSLAQLIHHRTRHRWICRDGCADLLVLHEELRHTPAEASTVILHIGHQLRQADPGCGYLAIPFRAVELQDCLDRLGRMVEQRRPLSGDSDRPRITAAPWIIQLRRWPPQRLLTGPAQVRLAALIAGRPMSFASLCRHSELARETCADFVRRLSEAGLLHPPQSAALAMQAPAHPRVADAGVLARIRGRLQQLAEVRP